eukprot:6807043-Prymnesium_polylepis.2
MAGAAGGGAAARAAVGAEPRRRDALTPPRAALAPKGCAPARAARHIARRFVTPPRAALASTGALHGRPGRAVSVVVAPSQRRGGADAAGAP